MAHMQQEYFRQCISTQIRRKNFFDFACRTYNGSNACMFLLVEAYRLSGRKRHAIFINENYVQNNVSKYKDTFPKYALFMSDANVKDERRKSIGDETSRQISDVGLTWKDKIKKQKTALDVFRSITKMSGSTQIHPDIFDAAQREVAEVLYDVMGPELMENNYGIFDPNSSYQPPADVSINLPKFKKILREHSFDPDAWGIY